MENSIEHILQNLLKGNASAEEIDTLKQALSQGQVSIGGNVSQSVIILGNGNSVQLTPQAFDLLDGRNLLGDLERDLTTAEIDFGLTRLSELLPERAPILKSELDTLTRRLRATLKTDPRALGDEARAERTETLAQLNRLCLEVTDIAFNALCTGVEPPDYDSRSPFRGLESFRVEDAPYFFGREALTRKLVQKLNEHNFLAVLGASGSGKSSLVMAGLIPALDVPYTIIRPGAEPLPELEKALQSFPSHGGRGAGGEGLLVVDQFEELFTLSAREQRADFISRLLEQSKKIRVVITLRADFLGEVAFFKSLKDEVQNHQEIIPPMDEAELRRAMEGQAGCAGLRFESDLSQQMLDDVSGEPGAMPLLQHALWTLWTRRHGRWLRADEYRAFGGVRQAIASTAEAVYAHCTDFEKERLRDIFLRLTRLDEYADGRDTRRRVLLRDLIPADSEPAATTLLIKGLADARLVVVTGDEAEVVHEALIRYWERLRTWLDEDRDKYILLQDISLRAHRWEKSGYDESFLIHQKKMLWLAAKYYRESKYPINSIEQKYLSACTLAEKKEKDKVTNLIQRVFLLLIALILTLLFIGGPQVWYYLARERAIPGNWVIIPGGEFIMGMDEEEAMFAYNLCQSIYSEPTTTKCNSSWQNWYDWSGRVVGSKLPKFSIMDNEVTNAQYNQCVSDSGCPKPEKWGYSTDDINKPVTGLTWLEAQNYCIWLEARLPSESEWEKAARGSQGFYFPWGNERGISNANFRSNENIQSHVINQFEKTDINDYYVKNMAGNVREWTASNCIQTQFEDCNQKPGQFFSEDLLNSEDANDNLVVVKGGSTENQYSIGVLSIRWINRISHPKPDIGFRCACPPETSCKQPWTLFWIWFGKY